MAILRVGSYNILHGMRVLGGAKEEAPATETAAAPEKKESALGSILGSKSEEKAETKTEEKSSGLGGLLGGAKKDGDTKKSLGSLF